MSLKVGNSCNLAYIYVNVTIIINIKQNLLRRKVTGVSISFYFPYLQHIEINYVSCYHYTNLLAQENFLVAILFHFNIETY